MFAIFIIYIILNVLYCLILTSNISVNYVHIYLKLNNIITSLKFIIIIIIIIIIIL